MNIFVTAPFSEESQKIILSAANVSNGLEIRFDCTLSDEDFLSSAEVIIGDIPPEKLRVCHDLKWLQLTSAGADKYVYDKSVPDDLIITNATGAFGDVISEYVIGGILALFRDFFGYRDNQRKNIWKDLHHERLLCESRALILGCGDIGSKTAVKLKAFGAKTIGIRKNVNYANSADGFDSVFGTDMLDSEIPKADIIICCLPKTPFTEKLLDSRRLSLAKSTAVIVNVGRGAVIDTNALVKMLQDGKLSGAVLDVFEEEPLPQDSPLWQMKNVFITPHISGQSFGHSQSTERKIAEICAKNLESYLCGNPLINIVNRTYGYAEKS